MRVEFKLVIKNEIVQNIVNGGSRAVAALALGGAIVYGIYELEQNLADDHASRVEDCAYYGTPAAVERCTTNADSLHGVVGFVEGGALLITATAAIGVAFHGARQAFGYSNRDS